MNSIQFYAEALDAVAKGKWLQNTQTYESIVWKDPNDTVPKEVIDAKVAELQAEHDATQYQRDRKQEYPTIEELVVALYDEQDKASIIERRNAVKEKYPKPE